MIAQELHRNTCDDRQKGTVAIRDKNLIVDEIIGKRIAFVGHGNDRRSAGLHFLDIRKQLCVNVGLGCDYDDGTLFVDEGNRAVFHLGGRVPVPAAESACATSVSAGFMPRIDAGLVPLAWLSA